MRVFQHGVGAPGDVALWELEAGEEYASSAIEVAVGGGRRPGGSELHALRLGLRHAGWAASLGDAEPLAAGAAMLHRLRGLVVRHVDRREGRWLAFGGVPTPIPGAPVARLSLGGLATENLRWDEGWFSASAVGFSRGQSPSALGAGPDTLSGRGAAGTLGWRVPTGPGWLAGRLGTQIHGLEGRRALAGQHALQWTLQTPGLVIAVSDERATRRARVLTTDRLPPAARSEDRWNVQTRFARGKVESHLTGVVREGGEEAMATRTVQVGASGGLGSSPWYAGGDAAWERRALTRTAERRLSLHAGGLLAGGHALLARIERTEPEGSPAVLAAMAEASLALPHGARWVLTPRLGWRDGALDQAQAASRVTWPLPWLSTRVTASLVGSLREPSYRGAIEEAALALSFSPRLRDRADVEVRRLDLGGHVTWESSLAYDALFERYETPGQEWLAARDTGRVTVRVVRSGNESGVPDILVSLDGKELRFTDADGLARFDRVTPGVHVVAIEERSLPASHEIVHASRVFVTVEPGRVPPPVSFIIARSERRTRF